MELQVGGLSDQGKLRQRNEDSFLIDETMGLFLVADGLGGHLGGEVASQLAVNSLHLSFSQLLKDKSPAELLNHATQFITQAIAKANQHIHVLSRENKEVRGMGSTIAGLWLLSPSAFVFNVGDSRVYLWDQQSLTQISLDHSLVREGIERKIISEDEASQFPFRNIITRALGGSQEVQPEVKRISFEPPCLFLLCTDGLTTMVDDQQIAALIESCYQDPDRLCSQLVLQANEKGGMDNITVVAINIPE